MIDPIVEATDRYTEECGKESEKLDNCKECFICNHTIWPEENCKKVPMWIPVRGISHRTFGWAHDWCLENCESYTGEEAANE